MLPQLYGPDFDFRWAIRKFVDDPKLILARVN